MGHLGLERHRQRAYGGIEDVKVDECGQVPSFLGLRGHEIAVIYPSGGGAEDRQALEGDAAVGVPPQLGGDILHLII